MTYTQAIKLALDDAMAADPTVFCLGRDIADDRGGGAFKVTQGLAAEYGAARVRSTPVAEQVTVGAAVGAALAGMRPVAEVSLTNFMAACMDQIPNPAKLLFGSGGQTPVPLTIRAAAGPGVPFGPQQADLVEAWLAHTPGLKVVTPSCPETAYGLLRSCIADNNPCVFVESAALHSLSCTATVPERDSFMPLGTARVERQGRAVTLISYGRTMHDVRTAAERLADERISIEVIDLCTISPLDTETVLRSVAKTRRAVIAHDAVESFGVAAELSSQIHENLFDELAAPVRRVGAVFAPVPYSAALKKNYLVGPDAIVRAVRAALP